MKRTRLLAAAGVALVLAAAAFLCFDIQDGMWEGNFRDGEYRIAFRDPGGRPVQGVELRVEDESGRRVYGAVVAEYTEGHAPRSDAAGVLTFRSACLPFGGRSCNVMFLGCRVWEVGDGPPVYYCRFLHRGEEVYRVAFNDLNLELSRRALLHDAQAGPQEGERAQRRRQERDGVLWKAVTIQVPGK